MERHLRPHIAEPFHQEVRRAHPELEGSERMFCRAAPFGHRVRAPVQPVLGSLQDGFMLPALDAALPARRAFFFQWTG